MTIHSLKWEWNLNTFIQEDISAILQKQKCSCAGKLKVFIHQIEQKNQAKKVPNICIIMTS